MRLNVVVERKRNEVVGIVVGVVAILVVNLISVWNFPVVFNVNLPVYIGRNAGANLAVKVRG